MKASVKRMIMEGVARGGWSSVAVSLTKGLAGYHGMTIRREYGTNDAKGENLTPEQVTQIHELIMGDFAVYRMNNPDASSTWMNRKAENVSEEIERLFKKHSYDYHFFSVANAKKARAITPLIRSQEELDKSALICDALDRNEVFTFNVTRG
jgi:2,3-bisphosphoglycerate-independent phosphoglycerate mutase